VLPDNGTIIRQEIDRFLLAEGASPPVDIVESTSVDFGRAYVTLSDAVWFVPRGVVEAEIESGRLIALPVPAGAMEGPVGITTRADVAPSPAGRLLIDAVRRAARGLAAAGEQ
jgi:LysR family pca operon transcriptional activator